MKVIVRTNFDLDPGAFDQPLAEQELIDRVAKVFNHVLSQDAVLDSATEEQGLPGIECSPVNVDLRPAE